MYTCRLLIRELLVMGMLMPVLLCAPNNAPLEIPSSHYSGMHAIAAAGKNFLQGANDSSASASDLEKPPMRCSFTYNYWIDSTEVTVKEYADINGKTVGTNTGAGNDFPVCTITWFDAVLF